MKRHNNLSSFKIKSLTAFIVTVMAITGLASFAPASINPTIGKSSAACLPTAPPVTYGQVKQTVTVATAGTYRVWSRIKAPSTTANSYYFQVDSGCAYNVGDSTAIPANTWTWVNYQDGTTASAINVTLTAGSHQLTYTGKEADVQLDRVMLLTNTSCVPTGVGDNCAVNLATPPTGTPLTVTASSASFQVGTNVPANTRDGNLDTYWAACGDGQWIQYDLGSAQSVSSVGIAVHLGETQLSRVDIALSTNGTNWTTVITNQQTSASTALQYFNFTAASARYVRIIGHGNVVDATACWNSYSEVEVRGTAVTPPPTDTTSPTVSISAPASGTSVASGASVTINATAADNVGVTKVEFYVDGTLKSTDTATPYSYAWPAAGTGSHSLTARAYDAAAHVTTSAAVSITVTGTTVAIGDVNGDTRVNALDLSALLSHDGQNYPAADFNHDGTVGAADMAMMLARWTW